MSSLLKIKIKTLASESSHIRLEENKALAQGRLANYFVTEVYEDVKPDNEVFGVTKEDLAKESSNSYALYWNLHQHRKNVVRRVARNTQLAYGFLRGLKYQDMEAISYTNLTDADWKSIEQMVLKYASSSGHNQEILESFGEWKAVAIGHQVFGNIITEITFGVQS